jgi:hypothetical protein
MQSRAGQGSSCVSNGFKQASTSGGAELQERGGSPATRVSHGAVEALIALLASAGAHPPRRHPP